MHLWRTITMKGLTALWAGPTTLLGLLAALCSLTRPRARDGALVCTSGRGFARYFLIRRGYCAITLGYVILLTPEAPIDVMAHERVHVRQAERWGPLFIPAYLISMVVARFRGLDPYWNNSFEAEAREQSGR